MNIAPLTKLLEQKREEIAQLDRRREYLVAQEEAFGLALASMAEPAPKAARRVKPAPRAATVGAKQPDREVERVPRRGRSLSSRWKKVLRAMAGLHRDFRYEDILGVPGVDVTYALARTKMLNFRKTGLVEIVGKGVFRLTEKGIKTHGGR